MIFNRDFEVFTLKYKLKNDDSYKCHDGNLVSDLISKCFFKESSLRRFLNKNSSNLIIIDLTYSQHYILED